MLTVKGKGNSSGHRYTPVSEFDNATLAQKREYWRNKKREQRARRSEKQKTTAKPNLNSLSHEPSLPLQNKNESNNVDSLQTRNGTSSGFIAVHCQKPPLHHNPPPTTNKTAVKYMAQENPIKPVLIPQLNNIIVPSISKYRPLLPCGSTLRPRFFSKSRRKPPVFIQPKHATDIAAISSPCGSKSTSQLASKSALVVQQRPTNSHVSPAKTDTETEEEKAAKRRELWRIRKREQRAKLAAQLGKTKNIAQNIQKQQSNNGFSIHIQSQSLMQSQPELVKIPNLQSSLPTTLQTGPPMVVVKRPFEPVRKTQSSFCLSGITRAQCQTPKQSFHMQRLLKSKSPAMSSMHGNRDLPQINPNDTPEQVIAKKREYWQVKKREQRAKLSGDVKLRLKEKNDFQRRVKRYQKILEDMRKARSQSIMHASEPIGGFIKEDGTVTINIPQVNANISTPAQRIQQVVSVHAYSTPPQTSKHNLPPSSHPVPGRSSESPPEHLPIRSCQMVMNSTQTLASSQTQASHLMLTPASLKSGLTTGGCVMKMAVSCKAPIPVKAYLDPSLTEEERMAKRREYWRVKKREQRAARTLRLRQGISQARASAVLLKKKAQKHSATVPKQSGSIPNNNMAYVNEIKQESELKPAVDLNLKQAICAELKLPMSRTPPPAQVNPDPALIADNQATTLLAVASMKKLLEESLSSVTEHKLKTDIKTEAEDENMEEDIKPDVSLENICKPMSADVTTQTKSSQAYTKILEHVSFEQNNMSPINSSTIPHCASDTTPEASSYIVTPKTEPSEEPCTQRRTLRSKKTGHQHCCSPGPPKLHHPPIEIKTETEDQNYNRAKFPHVMSLDQKREYWKLMKRQQRARLKARQRSSSNVTSFRTVQPSGCIINKKSAIKPALQPKPATASGSAATSMPSVLLVSPTVANAGPQGTLRVKSPVCSRDSVSGSGIENTKVNISVFPTIKPPDNPLSSMPIQHIESPQSKLRSITIPCPPKQNNVQYVTSRSIGTIVPPKPIPGESEEDFQKRKREYWRVKKKEQRARKAFQDKDKPAYPNSSQYIRQEALHDVCEQESIDWIGQSMEQELINDSVDSDVDSFQFQNCSMPIEEVFPDYESTSGEEATLSGDFWRNHYLMDHDPLNQLLVCMVCGELQYVHSVEGVQGHIEEAHPHTLNLEPAERHRILQAWDEQVFHRERFFTNQLQQHSASMTEAHMN